MAEAFGDELEVFTSFEEHGGVSVTHGVDSIAIAKFFGVHVEVADCVRAHEFAVFVMDDEGIVGTVSCETMDSLPRFFTAKYGHEFLPDRDGAEAVRGFGRFLDDEAAGCLDDCLADS